MPPATFLRKTICEDSGYFADDEDDAQAAPNRGFIQSHRSFTARCQPDLGRHLHRPYSGNSRRWRHLDRRFSHGTCPSTPTSIPSKRLPMTRTWPYAAIFARRDTHPYFFRTRDGGKTWNKIVTGLPEAGIARVVREDPVAQGHALRRNRNRRVRFIRRRRSLAIASTRPANRFRARPDDSWR